MTRARTATKGILEALSVYDDPSDKAVEGEWSFLAKDPIRTSRWEEHYWLVLQHADGTVWGIDYAEGLTEMQETNYPWDDGNADDELELTPLVAYDTVVTNYRPVGP